MRTDKKGTYLLQNSTDLGAACPEHWLGATHLHPEAQGGLQMAS